MTLRNGVLVYLEDGDGDVSLTLRLTKPRLLALVGGDNTSPRSRDRRRHRGAEEHPRRRSAWRPCVQHRHTVTLV
ncbi:hypothetical protein [Microbacterium sp. H1-D42]|uniref:hypothetical protein n=1 Tax=Microbacterium sp. H1-D42 TaxID=2925844 RepID=UPI001F537752|nr:hypothetical protein [Microbacterium sp. H1-D42]UNK70811.1 hypothetical protein MNR00_16915 [Microbacterium sp. H1-D42]